MSIDEQRLGHAPLSRACRLLCRYPTLVVHSLIGREEAVRNTFFPFFFYDATIAEFDGLLSSIPPLARRAPHRASLRL